MKEIRANLWDFLGKADALCVTTNGIVRSNGELVMGAGLAQQFARRFPELPAKLGRMVKAHGNHVHALELRDSVTGRDIWVLSLPTKEHFKDTSGNLPLVKRSLEELVHQVDLIGLAKVVTVRPGCGLGNLDWETEVKPLCENLLDDRFVIVS